MRRGELGAAAGAGQRPGRLRVALRAKGKAEQGKAGWYFASTFSFQRVLWIQMHPLCLALLAMVALQQRFPLMPVSALETRPQGCPWAPSKATLLPHVRRGLLCAGRPRSDPRLCRPTRADTACAQCSAQPTQPHRAGRPLGLSLLLNQLRGVWLPRAPAALPRLPPKASKKHKRVRNDSPPPRALALASNFVLWLRNLSDEDPVILPCSPQVR